MAATKRNAGLTSAVPRATLNDEELVRGSILRYYSYIYYINYNIFILIYLTTLLNTIRF